MSQASETQTRAAPDAGPAIHAARGDLQESADAPDAMSVIVDCGWGRLIFGQTFKTPQQIAEVLLEESEGRRDVALYAEEPHVVLAAAPQALFLDPSHTFRLDLRVWKNERESPPPGINIRAAALRDETAVNRLYRTHNMVPVTQGFCAQLREDRARIMLVAEEAGREHAVVGVVMGVDHNAAFGDPEQGSSLWALAVDPQAQIPGIGASLVAALADRFRGAGRRFMDLSVMHDNREAIALYEKLSFERVPVYCVKRKNPINEKLFVGPRPEAELNIYAQIIVDEARRRGITVEIEDAESGLLDLSLGGRAVACRESLSDLTSAVALSRCDDKRLTRRLLKRAGLAVPDQITVEDDNAAAGFLRKHRRVVVKPARGEMGRAVAVDLRTPEQVRRAVVAARRHCNDVIMEQFIEGQDLRIVVINDEVVAAAVRRPPSVRGDGIHTVIELIDKGSRRREAATHGESKIPLDEEVERCVRANGHQMLDVPDKGEELTVLTKANLHVGGTIHDVTESLNPALAAAAVAAARALDIPVVGFDFMVSDPGAADYAVIEANERPGLANHEPQPTAERFIDFLFPQTRIDRTFEGVRP